jgi:hypothetical protein
VESATIILRKAFKTTAGALSISQHTGRLILWITSSVLLLITRYKQDGKITTNKIEPIRKRVEARKWVVVDLPTAFEGGREAMAKPCITNPMVLGFQSGDGTPFPSKTLAIKIKNNPKWRNADPNIIGDRIGLEGGRRFRAKAEMVKKRQPKGVLVICDSTSNKRILGETINLRRNTVVMAEDMR